MQFAGVLADCTLSETGEKSSCCSRRWSPSWRTVRKLNGITLPEPDVHRPVMRWQTPAPRIVLNDGVVSYNDRPIINHLSWTVNPGEHCESSVPTAPVNPYAC